MINPNSEEIKIPKLISGFSIINELEKHYGEVTGQQPDSILNQSSPTVNSVNHPEHYNKGGIECLDAIAALGHAESFCVGNCLKYLWRYKHKNGIEDLKKAQFYLNWYIDYLQKQEANNQ